MATAHALSIVPVRLEERLASGRPVDLIDVRTPAEFREVHAAHARNVPLDWLDAKSVMEARGETNGEPLYIICKSGGRAKKACEKFIASGFPGAVSVEGGTEAWQQAGLPVVRGRKAISLERQVRMAAGSLVLVGAVLALSVHPYFAAVGAFVGAGLTLAGITDSCAMAMLLAKMPWNRATR